MNRTVWDLPLECGYDAKQLVKEDAGLKNNTNPRTLSQDVGGNSDETI